MKIQGSIILCCRILKDDSKYIIDYKYWNSDNIITIDFYEEEEGQTSKEKMYLIKVWKAWVSK